MKKSVKLTSIQYLDEGHKILYQYTYDKAIGKYFNPKKSFYVSYEVNVSQVPLSIAVIPFLANFVPIAWFGGFDIIVDEVDSYFLESLTKIKQQFAKSHPIINIVSSTIKASRIIDNKTLGNTKTAMLFSGGVDAYATYIRHKDEKPDLITIWGADVPLEDKPQWSSVVALNEEEGFLKENKKNYITSNLREFYTYKVDLLLESLSWWGCIQHGLALTGVTAPLSYLEGYNRLYIASTHTKNIMIPWGSSPYTDNLIKWSGLNVVHDGYELERIDKIEFIITNLLKSSKKVNLRVCYSDLNKGTNCSKCEKCVRTMFAITICNGNPNDYGFNADESMYDQIHYFLKNYFNSKGIFYHWSQLIEKANQTSFFHIFKDRIEETKHMNSIRNTSLVLNQDIIYKLEFKNRMKFIIRNKFSFLYVHYLKFRQKES